MLKFTLVLLLIAAFISVPSVVAFSFPSIGGNSSSSGSLLSAFSTSNASDIPVYAALFALAIFVIFYQVLQRTTLGGGATSIALIFAAITFVFLYSNPKYLQLFLSIAVMTIIMVLLLVALLIPSHRGKSFSKLVGFILLLVLVYLVLSNNSALANGINGVLGIKILNLLPIIIVGVTILIAAILLLRIFRHTSSFGAKVLIPLIILFLIAFFFIPGFGLFLMSPVGLAVIGLLTLLAIVWTVFLSHSFSGSEQLPPSRPSKTPSKIEMEREIFITPGESYQEQSRQIQRALPHSKESPVLPHGKEPLALPPGKELPAPKSGTPLKDLNLKGKMIFLDKNGNPTFHSKKTGRFSNTKK